MDNLTVQYKFWSCTLMPLSSLGKLNMLTAPSVTYIWMSGQIGFCIFKFVTTIGCLGTGDVEHLSHTVVPLLSCELLSSVFRVLTCGRGWS